MSKIELVSDATETVPELDVVLIHGLDGDARSTWQNDDDPDAFWPRWLAEDFPSIRIWAVDYEAAPTLYKGTAMPISDRANNLLQAIRVRKIGTSPMVLMGHSMGGLLIKQMLRTSHDNIAPLSSFLSTDTIGIALIATPNAGSRLAYWVSKIAAILRLTEPVHELVYDKAFLRELNTWFRNYVVEKKPNVLVLAEAKTTVGVRIVDSTSGDPGLPKVVPVLLDSNHKTICKCSSRNDEFYLYVRQFTTDCLSLLKEQTRTRPVLHIAQQESYPPEIDHQTTIRKTEYSSLRDQLLLSPGSFRSILIYGTPPGIGKTTFAFGLSHVLFGGKQPCYIDRGVEDSLTSIASNVQSSVSDVWMDVLRRHARGRFSTLVEDTQFRIVAEVLLEANLWLLVEAGETLFKRGSAIGRLLDLLTAAQSGIHIVATSRQAPQSASSPPHLQFLLHEFSTQDTSSYVSMFGITDESIVAQIHDRFKGHALSISSFANMVQGTPLFEDPSSLSSYIETVPTATNSLFFSCWKMLTDVEKITLLGISDDHQLGLDSIVLSEEVKGLVQSGLLSRYPTSVAGGVAYYVHSLVREFLETITTAEERQRGVFVTRTAVYRAGHYKLGPDLLGAALHANEDELAGSLLIKDGRAWIEVAGIEKSLVAFEHYRSLSGIYSPNATFLLGLCDLFMGRYAIAQSRFEDVRDNQESQSLLSVAALAEIMECERRKGNLQTALDLRNELHTTGIDSSQDTQSYLSALPAFLEGHLLRTLGDYKLSSQSYRNAETILKERTDLASVLEGHHCMYSRLFCSCAARSVDFQVITELLSDVHPPGSFLNGLFSYLSASSLGSRGDMTNALKQLDISRKHFIEFCSTAYIARSACLAGLIHILVGDLTNAEHAFTLALASSAEMTPTHTVSSALHKPFGLRAGTNDKAVFIAIEQLVNSSKLATASSLIRVFREHTGRDLDLTGMVIDCHIHEIQRSNQNGYSYQVMHIQSVERLFEMLLNKLGPIENAFLVVE